MGGAGFQTQDIWLAILQKSRCEYGALGLRMGRGLEGFHAGFWGREGREEWKGEGKHALVAVEASVL